jgi:HTH-type transcriptional regulator / antitoxin HigA
LKSGKITATTDKKKYLDPIDAADISPNVIETEEEYDRFLVVAENLIGRINIYNSCKII